MNNTRRTNMLELLLFIILIIAFIVLPKQRLFDSLGKTINNTADSIDLVNTIWADGNDMAKKKWDEYKSNQLK